MRIENDRIVTVDVDDTLCIWDISDYPELPRVRIGCFGYTTEVSLNQKNINLVKKLQKLGYQIIVWSQSGSVWAQSVAAVAGIDNAIFMSKPRYHIDDLPSHVWMGERLWRHPITGKSNDSHSISEAGK